MKHDLVHADLKAMIDELRLTPAEREQVWHRALDRASTPVAVRDRNPGVLRIGFAVMGVLMVAVLGGIQLMPSATQRSPRERPSPVERGLDSIAASSVASQTTVPSLEDLGTADQTYVGRVSSISDAVDFGLVPVHMVRLTTVQDVRNGAALREREIAVVEGTRSVTVGETYLVATNLTLLADTKSVQYPIFMGRATQGGYLDNIFASDLVVTHAELEALDDVELP